MKLNQAGFGQILALLLLLGGITGGVYLVSQQTNLLPQAATPKVPQKFPEKVRTSETSFSLVYKKGDSNPKPIPQPAIVSGGLSEAGESEGSSEASEDLSMPSGRVVFSKGEKVAVRLSVASDVDASNLFAAKINFPKDLLEVSFIQTEKDQKVKPPEIGDLSCDNQGKQCPEGYSCALPALACLDQDPAKCQIKGKCSINQGTTKPSSIPGSGGGTTGAGGSVVGSGVQGENTGPGQAKKGPNNISSPSCQPRPACLDGSPRCLLPEPAGGWCQPKPDSYQYFIQTWVANKYDNNTGTISLIGGVYNPGFKTDVKKSLATMATIYFVAKNNGEGEIKFDDSSVIYRNSDNENILQIKRNLSFQVINPTPVPSRIPKPSGAACPAIAILCSPGTHAETSKDKQNKCPVQICVPDTCAGKLGQACPDGFSCQVDHPENSDQGGKCIRKPSPSVAPSPIPQPAKERQELDLNNDGRINLTDLFALIKMMTSGG